MKEATLQDVKHALRADLRPSEIMLDTVFLYEEYAQNFKAQGMVPVTFDEWFERTVRDLRDEISTERAKYTRR